MAKGSAMGLWRGKKGSSVFYKIANSNSAQKQGIRERNYEPANPQTANQAGQRMKLLPAQRVYGVLKDIIERSWQGVKYGEGARREFLKLALSQSDGWPSVEKNSPLVIPGAYQIAKGTLTEVSTVAAEGNDSDILHLASLSCPSIAFNTMGDVSKGLLDHNSYLAEGMQITFIICHAISNNNSSPVWKFGSFIIDPANEEDYNDWGLENGLWISSNGGSLAISAPTDEPLYASAVILSQDSTTPLRSNAKLFVNTALLSDFFGNAARIKARATYMKRSSTVTRDWPVEEYETLDDSTYEAVITLDGISSYGEGLWNYSSFNGKSALIARKNVGDAIAAVYVKMGDAYIGDSTESVRVQCVVDANGRLLTGTVPYQEVGLNTNLPVAAVPSLASLRKISLDA